MRVAFVQMNCEFGAINKNINRARELIQLYNADLFVLPELFNTGYLFRNRKETASFAEQIPEGNTSQILKQTAVQKKCFIAAGIAEKAGKKIYNSSLITGPEGFIAVYRKIHLFDEEKQWFDPGDKPFFVVNVGAVKVGLMICFDWIFPESMRSLAMLGADVICHSANLVLPYCQQAMTTRCLENGVFAITANRIGFDDRGEKNIHFTGQSQITGPRGEIIARAGESTEEVKVVRINPFSARNKFINPQNDLLADRRPELYNL
ncbi:acyltransferase [candidate division KSB1 bacterium]|nr:acyltransferase [candidate division KSB1 bacterium]